MGIQALRNMVEEARIFDEDKYDWYVYKGTKPVKVMFRNNEVVINAGEKFGVRDSTSSPGKYRLVTEKSGTSRVMTPDFALVTKLLKASKPARR